MKTATLTYPSPHLIDTALLAGRYAVLCASIMSFIAAGRIEDVLTLSHKVLRLVRVFTKLETQNVLLTRKLDMLCDKAWRERVLGELGGLRKLRLWEAARKRIEARREDPPKAARLSISEQTPAWLLTPERLAESERLKAHARMCGRAAAHPLVFRDRVKMDFDGLFRLAPLPRGERANRQLKIYTQNSIVDYDWNAVPFSKVDGFGPASVWPVEFYAAMAIEAEVLDGHALSSQDSSPRMRGPRKNNSQQLGSRLRGNDWKKEKDPIPLLPLSDVLSPKVRRDLLGSLTS